MWMMGYNEEVNLGESTFNGRKLRPLVPRLPPAASSRGVHKPDLFSFNPHYGMVDQSKRDHLNSQQVVVTSRWNPTPEQLQALEELYRRGTRTPSADQIQHITAQLRRYGKIEGKNVFYWFQNHKARERQKRRRQIESEPIDRDVIENTQDKESGGNNNNRTSVEIQEMKSNWAYPTNCSSTSSTLVLDHHQKSFAATLPRAAEEAVIKASAENPEYYRDAGGGWIRFDEKFFSERNATWQMVHLLNPTTTSTSTTTSTYNTNTTNTNANTNNITAITTNVTTVTSSTIDAATVLNPSSDQDQTLELFPLRSGNLIADEEVEIDTCDVTNAYQFFEFLPLKN